MLHTRSVLIEGKHNKTMEWLETVDKKQRKRNFAGTFATDFQSFSTDSKYPHFSFVAYSDFTLNLHDYFLSKAGLFLTELSLITNL